MPLGFLEAMYADVNGRLDQYFARQKEKKELEPLTVLREIIEYTESGKRAMHGSDFGRRWNLSSTQVIIILKECVLRGGAFVCVEPAMISHQAATVPEAVECDSWAQLHRLITQQYIHRILRAGTIQLTQMPELPVVTRIS
jgi:hypothetical protein